MGARTRIRLLEHARLREEIDVLRIPGDVVEVSVEEAKELIRDKAAETLKGKRK